MWPIPASHRLVIVFASLVMWIGRQSYQGAILLPFYFAAAGKSNTPAYLLSGPAAARNGANDDGQPMVPGGGQRPRRGAPFTTARPTAGSTVSGSAASAVPTASTIPTASTAAGRPSRMPPIAAQSNTSIFGGVPKDYPDSNACGDVVRHVEEILLRTGTTRGAAKQHVALNCLRLLLHAHPGCVSVLMRPNIYDLLLKILQQRHQRSIWETVNSYIRSFSQDEEMAERLTEVTALALLHAMALHSAEMRRVISRDNRIKTLLLRIYVFDYKTRKAQVTGRQGATASSETDSSDDTGSNVSGEHPDDTCISSSLPDSVADLTEETSVERFERLVKERISMWDTQRLVNDILGHSGYEIDHWAFMSKFKDEYDNLDNKDSPIYDAATLIKRKTVEQPPAAPTEKPEAPETATAGETPAKQVEPPGPQLLWIPYCYSELESNAPDAIRRYLHIYMGEEEGSKVNLDGLRFLTIETPRGHPSDLVYGLVFLCKDELNTSGTTTCHPEITRMERSAAGTPQPLEGYNVLSNVQVAKSQHMNGTVIVEKILSGMKTATSLRMMNEMVNELWTLLGSKEKEVIEIIGRDLDLECLATFIRRSLLYTRTAEIDSDPLIDQSVEEEAPSMLKSIKSTVWSYFSSVVPAMPDRNLGNKHSEIASDPVKSANQAVKIPEVVTPSRASKVVSDLSTVPAATTARHLQTSILGFLVDLIYLNGVSSLATIRSCKSLVEAVECVRDSLPPAEKLADVLDTEKGKMVALVDRRRTSMRNKTTVIYRPVETISKEDIAALRTQQLDELGNIKFDYEAWSKDSWMRQRVVKRSAMGPFFNGNKLLNILGQHKRDFFRGRGLRILSIDGGGSKGVVALEMLGMLEKELGKPLHEVFDFVCGTSCGGIIGAMLVLEKAGVSDIKLVFEKMLAKVFTRDSYRATSTRIIMRRAYYDERVLYESLRHSFGTAELIDYSVDPACPKFCCLSVQLDIFPLKPIIWRNYNYPLEVLENTDPMKIREGAFAIQTADALRATTAAPTYFPLMERNGSIYADGALYANNPTLLAMLEAQQVYPGVPIDCLVSVGSGDWLPEYENTVAKNEIGGETNRVYMTENGVLKADTDQSPAAASSAAEAEAESVTPAKGVKDVLLRSIDVPVTCGSGKVGIDKLLHHVVTSATGTEIVHGALEALMDSSVYFRLNPIVPVVKIDNTDPEVLEELKTIARGYMNEDAQVRALAGIRRALGSEP